MLLADLADGLYIGAPQVTIVDEPNSQDVDSTGGTHELGQRGAPTGWRVPEHP